MCGEGQSCGDGQCDWIAVMIFRIQCIIAKIDEEVASGPSPFWLSRAASRKAACVDALDALEEYYHFPDRRLAGLQEGKYRLIRIIAKTEARYV